MARKACRVDLAKKPLFKPKGCTTKRGIHVHGKFVTPKGHVYDSKKKGKEHLEAARKAWAKDAEPPKEQRRRIVPEAIQPAQASNSSFQNAAGPRNSSHERIQKMVKRYEDLAEAQQANRKKPRKKGSKS